jgi:hypothetical protein
MMAVRLTAEHGREQANHRRPLDRRAFMVPGPIPRDPHSGIAASLGVPLVDRRQATLIDQLLKLGEADSLKLDGWTAFGHDFP